MVIKVSFSEEVLDEKKSGIDFFYILSWLSLLIGTG
jgi:hypothetical protein